MGTPQAPADVLHYPSAQRCRPEDSAALHRARRRRNLASTMRYLRPAVGKESQERINAIRWG